MPQLYYHGTFRADPSTVTDPQFSDGRLVKDWEALFYCGLDKSKACEWAAIHNEDALPNERCIIYESPTKSLSKRSKPVFSGCLADIGKVGSMVGPIGLEQMFLSVLEKYYPMRSNLVNL